MGKPEDEISLSVRVEVAPTSSPNVEREYRISGLFRLRCLLVLLLGIGVFLSAVFWLPPFFKIGDLSDSDLDPRYRGHDIVASFKLDKPMSSLEDNMEQLEADILDEIEVPNAKVVVLSLENSPWSNITDVVFGVDPETKYSSLSSASQSLIRASFESLVIRQSSLQLTTSLFGEPYFFEVLKFPDGITVTPPQPGFLLQKFQIFFNFSLNFSIYQIEEYFDELKSQLKSGLHLASYENLYISLTNAIGCTVAPPSTVQASVFLAVGITPSMPRLKQLAQTIKNSHGRNLGLNHTIFGKVKQVSLSSILQHSLNGGDSRGGSLAPAPAPATATATAPMVNSRHRHHQFNRHHYHHHHQDHDNNLAPAFAPSVSVKSPLPAPKKAATPPFNYFGPPGCRFGLKRRHAGKTTMGSPAAPAVAPGISPYYSTVSHRPLGLSPVPAFLEIPSLSPLPHVVFAHVLPPLRSKTDSEPPDKMFPIAPSPSACNMGIRKLSIGRNVAYHFVLTWVLNLPYLKAPKVAPSSAKGFCQSSDDTHQKPKLGKNEAVSFKDFEHRPPSPSST
ncbi:hypothetical protein Nepgr_031276 [Nepenthes gracilis]|uniref:DUF7036 domain-containing protein n=1 Tax=Nepenthes gracilis TaxID=150966 RepID=A0AAD3TG85_NEPGR|nr:hypothetical protein Nepgr_031276 [Nepenthes gracilis]